MKLSKIYANTEDFKPIIFNDGFNVIYGNVEESINPTKKVQEHNLGKTSLVYLIDFLLLKGVSKDSFFDKHKIRFSDWVFFLEVELNDGNCLTIRRGVNPNTKISFKSHFSKNQNFSNEEAWDHTDLPLTSTKEENNPKKIFEKYLGFDVAPDFSYRAFLSHLLRTQNDYGDVFRMNKYNQSSDKDWKLVLFNLLGFDYHDQLDKYEKLDEVKQENKIIKKLKAKGESSEIYKIKAAIEAKELEKRELEKEIDGFNFYKQEKNISFDLVKKVEKEISILNKENYLLSHNIEKIKQSLDFECLPSIQVDEIKKIFEESKVFFPDNLSKNYQEVITFSQQITKERNSYLKDELIDLKGKQKQVDVSLKLLDNQRAESLSLLKEKDSFIKYKKYQEALVKIEGEIIGYQQKLEGAKTIGSYQESLEDTSEKIKELSISIKESIDSDNSDYREIRRLFQEIYKNTFEYTALLVVEPNTVGNVNFTTSVLNASQNLTGKGDGYTSTKVLCASFILSVLIHYADQSFFRFSYHDGLLESWGDTHKSDFITLVRGYCEKHGIQYTISLIKSDIPDGFEINENEIIRTLSKGDELFGCEF